jgi:hypothetical protein
MRRLVAFVEKRRLASRQEMGKEEGWVSDGRHIVVVLALFNDKDG